MHVLSGDVGPVIPLIAVAEPYAPLRALMRDVLEDAGYRVAAWDTGDKLLTRLKVARPDVAIVDVAYDGPDAPIESLRRIHRDPATADMPILVTSADVAFLRAHASAARMQRYVVMEKPFDADALIAGVAALLARSDTVRRGIA